MKSEDYKPGALYKRIKDTASPVTNENKAGYVFRAKNREGDVLTCVNGFFHLMSSIELYEEAESGTFYNKN